MQCRRGAGECLPCRTPGQPSACAPDPCLQETHMAACPDAASATAARSPAADKEPFKPSIWRWEESDDAVRAYVAFFGILLAGCIPAVQASWVLLQLQLLRQPRISWLAPLVCPLPPAVHRRLCAACPAINPAAATLTELGAAGEPVCRPALLPGPGIHDHLHWCALPCPEPGP